MNVRVTSGFTMIELLVVITVIGILLSVGIVAQTGLRDYAADRERADDVASIIRRLEQSYTNQDLGTPSYPSTLEIQADMTGRTRSLGGISADALTAPGASGPSIVPATSDKIGEPEPAPTATTYVYQPLTSDDKLCKSNSSSTSPANNCVRFFVYYLSVTRKAVLTAESVHQQ